jgi:hypothetical protein
MVTVDLRKGRDIDLQFDRLVNHYGLREAVETWQAWDKELTFKDGLLEWRLSGMTYKAIAGMTGMTTQKVSALITPLKQQYDMRCDANVKKIEAVLKREDPEYDYMVYQKTVVNELCALLMGGDEIKDVLVQISNIGETNDMAFPPIPKPQGQEQSSP